jgi:hypothetical protein
MTANAEARCGYVVVINRRKSAKKLYGCVVAQRGEHEFEPIYSLRNADLNQVRNWGITEDFQAATRFVEMEVASTCGAALTHRTKNLFACGGEARNLSRSQNVSGKCAPAAAMAS